MPAISWSAPYLLAPNTNATYAAMELFPGDSDPGVAERAYVNTYALTVDSSGRVHAAWPHGPITGNQEPWYAACDSGCASNAWSAPVNLATTAGTNGLPGTMNHAIRLTSDTTGRVGVVWRQMQPDGNVALVGTSWRVDRGWKPLELLFRRPFVAPPLTAPSNAIPQRDIRNPDLGYDSQGRAYLTWSRKGTDVTHDQYAPPGLLADQVTGKCICTVGGQVQVVYGDPVNTASGSFYLQAADLAAAAEGPALAFGRTYVSLFADDTVYASGIFGPGWRHTYEAKLTIPDPLDPDAAPIVIYEAPTGNRLRFTKEILPTTPYATTVYMPFPGVRATLIETDINDINVDYEYVLTLRDGSQQVFETQSGPANGRLKRLIDPQGRIQRLTYYPPGSDPLVGGLLKEVTDEASERTLHFTYQPTVPSGSVPYLQKVEVWNKPEAAGGAVITGQVVSFALDAGRLDTVTDLRGGITNYDYDDPAGLLTTITDPLNKVQVQNTYDLTTKRISRQIDADGVMTEYTYTQSPPQSLLTTAITVSRPTLVGGQLVAGTPLMELAHVYRPDGTLQQQSRAGRAIGYTTFGPSLEPTASVDALGRGTRIATTPTGLPTRVTDGQGKTTTAAYNAQQYPEVVVEPSGIKRIMLYDGSRNLRMERTIGSPNLPGGASLTLTTYYTHTNGRLTQVQAPDGLLTQYSYTALGQVESVTTAASGITRYGYDALGRRETTTHGYGTSLARTDKTLYNADGTVQASILNYDNGSYSSSVPDQDVRTDYGYDILGRPLWRKTVDGRYHGYTRYTARGEVDWTVENPTNGAGVPTLPGLTDPRPAFDPHYPDRNVSTDYTYDDLGRVTLTTQHGLLGNTFNDDDDGDGQDERWFENAAPRTTKTVYDPQGRVLETIQNYVELAPATADTNVSAKSYYDAAGQLIWQGDHANRWTKYDYDTLGRPVKTIRNYENSNPETVESDHWEWTNGTDTDLISYTSYQATTGWVEKTIQNYVDGAFDLVATRPITDRITQPTYDSLGRVTLTTQNVTGNTWSGTNLTSGTTYDAQSGRTLAGSDALGVMTSLRYDAAGRVYGTIRNCRSSGNLPIATGCAAWSSGTPDRNLASGTTGFDARGRTTTATDPLNYVTLTQYDAIDRVLWTTQNYQSGQTATQERNVSTGTTYNGLGQVTETRDATNQPTTYAYNGVGSQVSVTDAENRTWRQGSDGLGQTRWSATLDLRLQVTLVDGLGRPTTTVQNFEDGIYQSGPRPTYDGSDQDLITTTTYDRAGRVTATVDVMGRKTTYGYDQADRLIEVIENDVTTCTTPQPADCDVRTQYHYDRAGNQVAIIDARDKVRTFQYDAADQLVKQTDALNRRQEFTYDAAGRRLTMSAYTAANALLRQLTWEYDQLGRLRVQYDPAQATTVRQEWSYTQRDQPHTWVDKTALLGTNGTITYGYDPLGRVTSANDPRTGLIGYGYTARGERASLIYPGGETASYQYMPSGALDLLTVSAGFGVVTADYSYDAAGRVSTVTKDGVIATTTQYDDADRIRDLTTIFTSNGTTKGAFLYERNRRGSPTSVTREVNGASASYTYGYDALDRLTTAYHGASYNRAFTYDRAGNRLTESQAGAVLASRSYDDANQVTGWTYDALGNLTNDGARTYAYDAFGRLTGVTNGTTVTGYTYHGEELLQQVETGGRTTVFTQDRAGGLSKAIRIQRSGTKPLAGLPLDETVWYGEGAERIGVHANGTTRTYDLADALGTVHGTLQGGSVATNHAFDPWGSLPSGNRQTAAGFTGEVQDSSTGLVYLRARWYNPATGTLLGKDPFGGWANTPYSMHPYQYGYSNPVSNTDPSGKCIVGLKHRDYGAISNVFQRLFGSDDCLPIPPGEPLNWKDAADVFMGAWEGMQGFDPENSANTIPVYQTGIDLADGIYCRDPVMFARGLGRFVSDVDLITFAGFVGKTRVGIKGTVGIADDIPPATLNGASASFNFKDEVLKHYDEINKNIPKGGTERTAAILVLPDGTVYRGQSGITTKDAVPDVIQRLLKDKQHPYGFACAEIDCILQAIKDGGAKKEGQIKKLLGGSKLTTAHRNELGQIVLQPKCGTSNVRGCDSLLSQLGIEFIGW